MSKLQDHAASLEAMAKEIQAAISKFRSECLDDVSISVLYDDSLMQDEFTIIVREISGQAAYKTPIRQMLMPLNATYNMPGGNQLHMLRWPQ
jgi:hypothetical protein